MLERIPFVRKFRKDEIDWNSKYDLRSDPILPMSEIIKKDRVTDAFIGLETIEDVQRAVSDIQLIPAVPEQVKKYLNEPNSSSFLVTSDTTSSRFQNNTPSSPLSRQ